MAVFPWSKTVLAVYWEYEYTADNLLQKAYYKGEIKAEYSYDADGKRIVSDTEEGKRYFVFNYSGKVIYEESIGSDGENKVTSYVYALSKQMARVEGVIGGEGEVIYYHHDNLGSTRLMTNSAGKVVFDQDYLPFGGDLAVVGDLEPVNDVGEGYKYTGQRQEVSIGLYYYGARFYDPDLGRFITEDSYAGEIVNPQGQNIYVYVMNNPMKYVDPSGHKWEFNADSWEWMATEETDKLWQLVDEAKFNSWQEAAEYAGIKDWYDDEGNRIRGKNRSLVGMGIKAPLDIYKAEYAGFDGTVIQAGYKDNSMSVVWNLSDVTVENIRTNDAFSTSLFSYISDSQQTGFSLPNLGLNVSTLYGAFPKHYSDFLTDEAHREELYNSLLGDTKLEFTNFVFGTYTRVENKYWRGESVNYGLLGKKIKIGKLAIGGIGKGNLIQHTSYEQKYGLGRINLIPGQEMLYKRKSEFERIIGVANHSGWGTSGLDWEKYKNILELEAEKNYRQLWGMN
ncbi:RHS repeat domain-containing protein [Iocasia frigidifontis]|nr:RHS repeat-associated core domain-containing protein [Iocasia fonsfrigidae]